MNSMMYVKNLVLIALVIRKIYLPFNILNVVSIHYLSPRCKDKKVPQVWEGTFQCKCERKGVQQIISKQSKSIFIQKIRKCVG